MSRMCGGGDAVRRREIVERSAVPDVERILRVPLDGEGIDDVVGVELALDAELHALPQLARPDLEVRAWVAAGRECRLSFETADLVLVERIEDLLADAKRVAVALVAAV